MQLPTRVPDVSDVAAGERHPHQGTLGHAPVRVEGVAFEEHLLLDRVMGDRDLARVVIQTFLEDIPSRFASMNELLRQKDRAGLLLHVHTIKGSAANVGGMPLSLSARELEANLPEETFERIAVQVLSLGQRFDELKVEMLAVLNRHSSG